MGITDQPKGYAKFKNNPILEKQPHYTQYKIQPMEFAGMNKNCNLCGTKVKVVGHTTKHYDPYPPTEKDLEELMFAKWNKMNFELDATKLIAGLAKTVYERISE